MSDTGTDAAPAKPDREFWTPEQAADEFFQIPSPYLLVKGAREGTLPHTRVGRRVRFSRGQLEEIARMWAAGPIPRKPVRGPQASRTVTADELAALPVSARSKQRHAHG